MEDMRFQLGQSDRFREGLVRARALADPYRGDAGESRHAGGAGGAAACRVILQSGRVFQGRAPPDCGSSCAPPAGATCASTRPSMIAWIRSAPPRRPRSCWLTTTGCSGTWPLALTAYNHGAEGMRRAKESWARMTSSMIVRNYHSRELWIRVAEFLRVVPGGAEGRPQPGKVFRCHQARARGAFQEVSHAGLRRPSAR